MFQLYAIISSLDIFHIKDPLQVFINTQSLGKYLSQTIIDTMHSVSSYNVSLNGKR